MSQFSPVYTTLVIELLAKLLLESKKNGRMFSSKKDEIGFENILRTMNVSKNFGCLQTSDTKNFGRF